MNGLVILNYNSEKLILSLIETVHDYQSISYIVVVDNNSTKKSKETLLYMEKKYKKIVVIFSDVNGGYSKGNNLGLKWLSENTDVRNAFIANPDVLFTEDYVKKISSALNSNEDYGLLTGVMKDSDGKVSKNQYWRLRSVFKESMSNIFIFKYLMRENNRLINTITDDSNIINVVPAGSLICVRLEILKEIDYFDEDFFLFFEENVLCKKIEDRGYKYGILLDTDYYHYHSQTIDSNLKLKSKLELFYESMILYHTKYNDMTSVQKALLITTIKVSFFTSIVKNRLRILI